MSSNHLLSDPRAKQQHRNGHDIERQKEHEHQLEIEHEDEH